MPQVATPGLVEIDVQISGATGSGPHYNIFHFNALSSPAVAASGAVSALTTFYAAIKSQYRVGTSLVVGFKAIDRSAVPWTFIPVVSTSTAATGNTSLVAPQLAMVVAWRTATIGKSYRGRTFLGPFDAVASGGASWTGAAQTLVAGAATALVATSTGSTDYRMVVYSHKHNTMAPITAAGVGTTMRTLRSRAF